MQILPEMLEPIFWEKKEKYFKILSAGTFTQYAKHLSAKKTVADDILNFFFLFQKERDKYGKHSSKQYSIIYFI